MSAAASSTDNNNTMNFDAAGKMPPQPAEKDIIGATATAARGHDDADASRQNSIGASINVGVGSINVGASTTTASTSGSTEYPSSPDPNTAGTTAPQVVTATKSPRKSSSSSRSEPSSSSSSAGDASTGSNNESPPSRKNATFIPRRGEVRPYPAPDPVVASPTSRNDNKDMPITGGIKSSTGSTSSTNAASNASSVASERSPPKSSSDKRRFPSPRSSSRTMILSHGTGTGTTTTTAAVRSPRRSLDVSPRRGRAIHGFSRQSPRRIPVVPSKSSTTKSIGLTLPPGSSITGGSSRMGRQNGGAGVCSYTGSPIRAAVASTGRGGGQQQLQQQKQHLPTFAALGSPENLLSTRTPSNAGGDAASSSSNVRGASTVSSSDTDRPVIIATSGTTSTANAAATKSILFSPKPTLTAAAVSSRAANLGSAQRYRIVASPGRQDAVLALSALCGAGRKNRAGVGGGAGAGAGAGGGIAGGRPRKISMGGDDQNWTSAAAAANATAANAATRVVRTGNPPAIISCDTSSTGNAASSSSLSTTGSSSHLIDRTPQGKTLSLSPTEDCDGKLRLFMEATREIRSKDLLKSPRPTPPSGKTSAATTPRRGGNSPRPFQPKHDAKRTPGTTRGGKKKSSGAAVTPLPSLPVDAHVTPASLAEQHQRDKFYAYYYHQQYYQQQQQQHQHQHQQIQQQHQQQQQVQQQQFASPHSGHYSPYYQYGGYWSYHNAYGDCGLPYDQGPAVATAISSKTKRRTKGGSMGRVPNSPVPRPPDVIAAKIQSAVKLGKKRGGGNGVISQDIMDAAGISEEKSSSRIAARAAKKAKVDASTADASDAMTHSGSNTDAKKVSPKKRAKTKKSSPPPKSPAAKSKAKGMSKSKIAAAAPKAGPQAGEKGYKRADKSLGLLCERFVEHYKNSHGLEIAVDDAATDLAVERRRIYDIINILEALRVVRRICKNTYTWHGSEVLPLIFASMQQDAIVQWKEQAASNGLVDASSPKKRPRSSSGTAGTGGKSMAALTCDFVKLFLAGDSTIAVTEAADRVLGTNSELYTERNLCTDEQKAEAKAMKSKIRRLYDIANVLASLNVIVKENCGASFQKNNDSVPQFRWIYAIPPKAFLSVMKDHGHLIPADPSKADPVIDITPYVKDHKSKHKKGRGKSTTKIPHSASKKSSKSRKTKK